MKLSPNKEYLRTKVLTASPAELRMMLLDGAVRFAEQAQQGTAEKNYERMFEGATRAQAILIELLNGLDPKHDPELCSRLSSLYTYMYTQLVKATSQRDPAMFTEVCKLLRYERETWQLLMSKLAGEQAPAAAPVHEPQAANGTGAAGQRLSIQG